MTSRAVRSAIVVLGASWMAFTAPLSPAAEQPAGYLGGEYPTGDACLFCHRNEIGATWLDNAHAWTIRPLGEPPAVEGGAPPADATHVVGRNPFRALRQAGYGSFALFSPTSGAWNPDVFGAQCAGCHATAVDPASRQFGSYGLDCWTCHGDVPERHASEKGVALLAKSRKADPREITSICGACHLRGGRSRAGGAPYPLGYIAGQDLFATFAIDLKLDRKRRLDNHDAHVYVKARAVLEGGSNRTCISCHRIHGPPQADDARRRRFSDVCQY